MIHRVGILNLKKHNQVPKSHFREENSLIKSSVDFKIPIKEKTKSIITRKLTFSRNQCIPMLLNLPKKNQLNLLIKPQTAKFKSIEKAKKTIDLNDNSDKDLSLVDRRSNVSIISRIKNTDRKSRCDCDEM